LLAAFRAAVLDHGSLPMPTLAWCGGRGCQTAPDRNEDQRGCRRRDHGDADGYESPEPLALRPRWAAGRTSRLRAKHVGTITVARNSCQVLLFIATCLAQAAESRW